MKQKEKDLGHKNTNDLNVDTSRRTFFKATGATLLAAPAILTTRKGTAQVAPPAPPPSPATTPWLVTLPDAIEPLPQTSLLTDTNLIPQGEANTDFDECGRNDHQRWNEFFNEPTLQPDEADTYELKVQAITNHVFHPDYPPQLSWKYMGKDANGNPYANPTIHARYGRPIIVRLHNQLPTNHTGFGTPEISLHLHNLHTPSESDGFPGDYFSETKAGPTLNKPGKFKDQFYPNIYAGFDEFPRNPNSNTNTSNHKILSP